MNKRVIAVGGVVVIAAFLIGATGIGALGSLGNVFEMLGGAKGVASLASNFVSASIRDPRLSALVSGKKIDPAATSIKVSDQLCAILGGSCKAPLTDTQLASATSKVTPDQSKAIWDNFNSALSKVVSDPMVRELVTKAVGSKIPGVLAGLL